MTKVIVVVTKKGEVKKFPLDSVRTSNRGSGTVKAIKLDGDDEIIGMQIAEVEEAEVKEEGQE